MTQRHVCLLLGALAAAACGGRGAAKVAPPAPAPTAAVTDSLWREAEARFNQGQWRKAQVLFDRLTVLVIPPDPRYYRMHFYLAEVLYAQRNHLQAVREFRRVADENPDGPLAADALVRAGDAYADLWRRAELDPTYGETARTVYTEAVSRYDATPAGGRARLRLAELAEKFARKEYKSGLFYFKYKAHDSAILVFRGLIANYPRAAVVPDALERLIRSYLFLGYQEDVKETCAYAAQYHPNANGPKKYCSAAPATAPTGAPGSGDAGRR
ncbi:MAG: outer membrane protein assembly factor BamD [Gemmatimonadales bacterium]|nr:outer membrane protein assembly factor BamD [Gemmatimonadales bacterium]